MRTVRISTTADRIKTHNLARDPRAALHVSGEDFWQYAVAHPVAQISPVASTSHDPTTDDLAALHSSFYGQLDRTSFDEEMIRNRRLVIRLTVDRLTGVITKQTPTTERHRCGREEILTTSGATCVRRRPQPARCVLVQKVSSRTGGMRRLISAVPSSRAAAMVRLSRMPRMKWSGLAIRAPKTAMATAPPTWRKVLNTALAVPARSGGTPSSTTAGHRRHGERPAGADRDDAQRGQQRRARAARSAAGRPGRRPWTSDRRRPGPVARTGS